MIPSDKQSACTVISRPLTSAAALVLSAEVAVVDSETEKEVRGTAAVMLVGLFDSYTLPTSVVELL